MSANFYELLKYAKTGIASPDMTYYDKMRASTLMGGVVQTLTGIPPLSFKANGTPLISWSMKGNGSQSGTPSPDSIIMPTFCGVRTGNLWSEDYTGISQTIKYVPIYVGNGDVTISTTCGRSGTGSGAAAVLFLLAGSVSTGASTDVNGVWNGNDRTVSAVDGYVTVAFRAYTTANPDNAETMLNLGSTALPYEPFGWAEKITCGGQTVPVYLGQTQTARKIRKLVLTGEEAISEDIGYNRFLFTIPDMRSEGVRLTKLFCTHYQNISDGRPIANVPNNSIYTGGGADSQKVFIKTTDYTTVAGFNAYLAAQYAAGTPVTVWYVLAEPTTGIINEPLAKIGDYSDELHSEDAGASIPTANGENTLTVDTELQPSEMTIKYR